MQGNVTVAVCFWPVLTEAVLHALTGLFGKLPLKQQDSHRTVETTIYMPHPGTSDALWFSLRSTERSNGVWAKTLCCPYLGGTRSCVSADCGRAMRRHGVPP